LDKNVTPTEYRVLSYLAWRQGDNGSAWPSQKTIATDLHVSRRHIQTTIKRLEQSGYVVIVKPEKQGRGYHLRYAIGNNTKGRSELHPLSEEKALRASPFTGKRAQKGARKGRSPVRTNTIQEHSHTIIARTSVAFVLQGGKLWHVPQAKLDEYRSTFAVLDVDAELRKAAQWLRDNPGRRKKAAGMPRFLGGWLGRAKPKREPRRGEPDWLPTEKELDQIYAQC